MQWGGSHVWKVGGPKAKVFAIGGWASSSVSGDRQPGITFKVSDIGWEVLREAPGCRPAPYLASRGMKWIQSYNAKPGLSKAELKRYLRASWELAAAGLPKKARREMGLA